MLCNTETNADDETTIFEPFIDFIESFFRVNDLINQLKIEINYAKKVARNKAIDREQFDSKITMIKNSFTKHAHELRVIDSSRHQKISDMLLNKLIQVILRIKIETLFDNDQKPNPHVSKKNKQK